MRRLKEAMLLLIAQDEPLPPEYLDHALSGEWSGFRECHIGGDFLLIYDLRQEGSVIFTRVGTHADLFEQNAIGDRLTTIATVPATLSQLA
jgi:mRNA interferase YafQ